VGRRLLTSLLFAALVAAAAATGAGAASAAPSAATWDTAQIRTVVAAGMMDARSVASFRGADPLTAQELEDLAFDLKARLAETEPEPLVPPVDTGPTTTTTPTTTDPTTTTVPATTTTTAPTTTTQPTTTTAPTTTTPGAPKQVPDPDKPVTMTQLDLRLVQMLGLGKAANEFAAGARAAGLKVPGRFGTEVVARLIGLRYNHPASDDSLELRPQDTATRAEAAFSAADILGFRGWEVPQVQALADAFSLPALTDWQKQILTAAFSHIGMPYIWGGTSDGTETEFGVTSRGGYDCSGFVWRVYKETPFPNEGDLASVLQGRTTYVMSGEVPKSKRIPLAKLQPADVVFFGDKGPRSQPAQVGHMGIYVGNGWFINSSSYGVALAQLQGWYEHEFAWGRRPLAEAGLE